MSKRGNKTIALVISMACLLGLSVVPAASAATAAVTCGGVIVDDVDGNVFVPDGVACQIFSTINGNVYVAAAGSLTLWSSGVVNGNIQSNSDAATSPFLGRAVDVLGTVNGNFTQSGDGIAGVYAGTVTGNVHMKGNGYLQISGFGSTTRVGGNVMNEGTGTTFVGSGFFGSVEVEGHVMDKGAGGGIFLDNWVGTFGITTIGKSVCGLDDGLVYETSSVAGKISADCSPRKK